MSSPPPPMIWPGPPPAGGTVIPFPLPWGQTGCCPPGGMDALMKCYCDIQQASAFIGQIMLDQINNNPAITAAIIAAIEKSGSNLPLLGVTNGVAAQPGQVGEYVMMEQVVNYTTTQGQTQSVSLGILQPGDWDCQIYAYSPSAGLSALNISVNPSPQGLYGTLAAFDGSQNINEFIVLSSPVSQVNNSTPQLIVGAVITNQLAPGSAAGTLDLVFAARRAR